MPDKKSIRSRVKWRVIDIRVKGNAAVEVSELGLTIPRYTFKLGTAKVDKITGLVSVGGRLSTFNWPEAMMLLTEVGNEYTLKRKEAIAEVEALKRMSM